MKNLNNYLILLLIFAFISCDGGEGFNDTISEVSTAKYNVSDESGNDNNSPVEMSKVERKLIKKGDIEFRTDDLGKTKHAILVAVNKYNGYISSEKLYKYDTENSINIVVRVPSDNFDNFLNESTKGVKDFDKKDIDVRDVTEDFLDVQARLKTKKELENRYIELLKKAQKISEILEIEKEIGSLRLEIESIEGRLNYLKNQVGFSTLNIRFYNSLESETGFGADLKEAFSNGWGGLIMFVLVLINLWPLLLILIGLIFILAIYRKRKSLE